MVHRTQQRQGPLECQQGLRRYAAVGWQAQLSSNRCGRERRRWRDGDDEKAMGDGCYQLRRSTGSAMASIMTNSGLLSWGSTRDMPSRRTVCWGRSEEIWSASSFNPEAAVVVAAGAVAVVVGAEGWACIKS